MSTCGFSPRDALEYCANLIWAAVRMRGHGRVSQRPACRAMLLDDNILHRNGELHRLRNVPLSMPATIMVGDRDAFLHVKLFSHVGTYVPHGTVLVVPKCSHWVQQDVPDKVCKALRDLAAV